MSLLRRVRLRRYRSEARGREVQAIYDTLTTYEKKMDKLAELQEWLTGASKELVGVPKSDQRWPVYDQVLTAARKLEKELEDLETRQEAALTEHLESTGPLTLEFEDGTRKVLAARGDTAGGKADLLPDALLKVWRVASVFKGSIILGDNPAVLRFGDRQQAATVKLTAKAKAPKKGAVVGEGALFGKD